MTELQNFKIEHNRLPTSVDKKMGGIITAINRGKWASDGINSWNNLLRKTFGKVNIERGKYIGEQSLNRAMAEMRNFKIEHNRLPKSTDKEMSRIAEAIHCGVWASDGINSWNDLLRKSFGMVKLW